MHRDSAEDRTVAHGWMNVITRRRSTPVEERHYGPIFFLVAVMLTLTTGWAVVDEVWVRRPWKGYQKEFYKLELQKAQAELRKVEERFYGPGIQARYRNLEQQLTSAEVTLQSEEYRQGAKELEEIQRVLADLSHRLQFTSSESGEAYYRYKMALKKGRSAKEEQQRFYTLEEEKERLTREVASTRLRRSVVEKRVRLFEQGAESLKDSLTSLKADVYVWQGKVEATQRKQIGIQQVVLPEFDSNNFGARIARVERCMTCHLGVEKIGFENEKNPFARHSYITEYHPVERYGCTPCHDGQGVALTVKAAHGQVESWPNPLLGEGRRERLCGKCHRDVDFPEAPTLSDGRKLFETLGCLGCHNVEGYVKVPNIGPSLNRIAVKVKPSWLLRWVLNPKKYLPKTKMPNFQFSEDEARAVQSYLLEMSKQKPGPPKLTEQDLGTQYVQEGETLFRVARCISCHSVNGVGGRLAPDLGGIGAKVRFDWLFDWIKNPKAYQPNTKMPRYRFTDRDILLIITYLNSLNDAEVSGEMEVVAYPADDVKRGERLVTEYGCLGCHDPVGQEAIGGKVGADLTFFGDKPIENLDFGDVADVPSSKEAWVQAKLQKPRAFSTERIRLKMPDFGLSAREATALSTVLLGFTEERPPDTYSRARKHEGAYTPPGEFGRLVADLNCLTCHTINGRGGSSAPDLSYQGSRANPEWMKRFLRTPTTLRPTLVERMPQFNLAEREIDVIVNYIRTALVNPDIPIDLLNGAQSSQAEIELGRKLYHEKYRCQSCHQINYEGGTMGPELVSSDTNIRERRTSGWIFTWIKTPQILDPATVEPNLGLSDEEALLITQYLLSY